MLQKVKGTYDVTPEESQSWRYLEDTIHTLMRRYHYQYVRTPIFEYYEVFHRHNELSDMVKKETYDFLDRGDRKLTLRPEGTAGVLRSFIEGKRYQIGHHEKVYYMGPNYRYERPQKGRYREFYQVGVEVIGDKHPTLDADIIKLSYDIVKTLGIQETSIHINYLGNTTSRKSFQDALITYLKPFREKLSDDSKLRLDINPLRILDSKDPRDHQILLDAPKLSDFLDEEDRRYYQTLKSILNALEVPFTEDPKLVRGLDYYGHTVFEIHADMEGFGAQNALGGGGRYDHLISEMGGPNVSGMGFAFGMERLLLAMSLTQHNRFVSHDYDVIIIPVSDAHAKDAYLIYQDFMMRGIKVYFDFSIKNLKTQFKFASTKAMSYAIIIDDNLFSQNKVSMKNLKTFSQEDYALDDVINILSKI